MGPVAIGMIGAGVILVWSGFQGVNALEVVKSVLSGQAVPRGAKAKEAADARSGSSPSKAEADEMKKAASAAGDGTTKNLTEAMREKA